MITKQQLDEHITKDYDRLCDIIQGMIYKKNSKLEPTTIIAAAYENMLGKLDKIEPNKISHYITSFARLSTSFKNNPINKENNFNYTDQNFIRTFTDKTIDYEDDYWEQFFIDEIEENIGPRYTLDDIQDLIDIWRQDLPLVDSIMSENLLEYMLNNKLDFKQIYNTTNKIDIEIYNTKIEELRINFMNTIQSL